MFIFGSEYYQRAILVFLITFSGYSLASAQDARLIAKNTFPSVVLLEMQDSNNRPTKLGSGFFVRSDVVATNYHVIDGASQGSAKIVGETATYRIEGTVGVDKSRDLVLLKLSGTNGRSLKLADVSQIEVGQEVFALGNPRGLEGTISPGIVSGLGLRKLESESLIQITAAISPGSSGGPVVNRQGEVIGVAVSSIKGQNLNFAIPSSYLALLLASTNTTSVKPLTSQRADVSDRSSNGISLEETESWLTGILAGQEGQWGKSPYIYNSSPDGTTFKGCSMAYYEKVTAKWGTLSKTAALVPMNLLQSVSTIPDSNYRSPEFQIVLFFSADVTYKWIVFGPPDESGTDRVKKLIIFVKDAETATRVKKGLEHLITLCTAPEKKDPF